MRTVKNFTIIKKHFLIAALITLLCSLNSISYAQKKLKEGAIITQYPKVKWLKGDRITRFEKDKIYLIACWSTWYRDNKVMINHLNMLYDKFGDNIVFVAQNVKDSNLDWVNNFLDKKDTPKIKFNLAFSGGVNKAFDKKILADINSLPTVFLIKDQTLLQIAQLEDITENYLQLIISEPLAKNQIGEIDKGIKNQRLYDLLFEEQYTEALILVDSLLEIDLLNTHLITEKHQLLDKLNRKAEMTSYIKDIYSKLSSDSFIEYLYFTTLFENKEWDLMLNQANKLLSLSTVDDNEYYYALTHKINALNGLNKSHDALVVLDNFINQTNNSASLKNITTYRLSSDNAYLDSLIWRASKKSLALDPTDLSLMYYVVKSRFDNNDKQKAQEFLALNKQKLELEKGSKNSLEVIKQIKKNLDKGIIPDLKEFASWIDKAM